MFPSSPFVKKVTSGLLEARNLPWHIYCPSKSKDLQQASPKLHLPSCWSSPQTKTKCLPEKTIYSASNPCTPKNYQGKKSAAIVFVDFSKAFDIIYWEAFFISLVFMASQFLLSKPLESCTIPQSLGCKQPMASRTSSVRLSEFSKVIPVLPSS